MARLAGDGGAKERAAIDTAAELPRITIVTPSYNGAEHLEDCIASVIGQGYPDLEHIVIDGGSTDGTIDILRRHESAIAYWSSEPDDGQADALNKGFGRATGELVAWLNADDFLYPGALEAVAQAYLTDPGAPFYFGNGYRVDRGGRELAEFFPDGEVHFRSDAIIFGLNCVLQPSAFIRRAALEQVGMIDATLHYGFDTDLWIRLSKLGRPRPIRKHLSASREYAETKTSSGSFPRAEELRVIAERYAGTAATPGSISYYLDTLHRLARARPDIYPPEYAASIEAFWLATSDLLAGYGARRDGFPVSDEPSTAFAQPVPPPKRGRTRIGVELRQLVRGVSGGMVVVVAGTLLELFRQRPDADFVVFATVFNRELLATDASNVEILTLPLDGYHSELRRMACLWELDVLIRSYPSVEEPDFPLKRQIFAIPDVQHEHHPEFFEPAARNERRRSFRAPLEGGGAIMTISEYARRTIAEIAPDRDVFVASPSLPPEFLAARSADATPEERALLPEGDFFYFPANLWPHKNHTVLFEAFRGFLARTGKHVELVLTGAPSGWEALHAEHADLPVRHLGYVSPALVKLLYERTLALTFFSRYEGFGIPLLEAFEVGTPVLCGNTTSLPEVAGDAALMCDPTDAAAISELLERIAGDSQVRAELVARGKERLHHYSWASAAEALSDGIERVIARAGRNELGEQPLVSIVTPSLNQATFIRRTIDSVLAQTYPNIEYLVVDGASTDGTLEILRSYGDRIRWISEPDSGQTEAINKGLRAATGEIVGYLNSDDVLLPHAIEAVVDFLRSHPGCDLVYGDAEYIDANDRVTGMYPTDDYSLERMMHDCCICQPAAYWRASVAEKVGPLDEALQYAMDFDYWIRVDRHGFALERMHETIARSRLHPAAKTLSARRAIYREIVDVSRRRGGYVSWNYVNGLWFNLAYEQPGSPARLLRRTPRLRYAVASAHALWLNRHLYTYKQRLRGLVRLAKRATIRCLRRAPAVLALLARVRRGLSATAGRLRPRSRSPVDAVGGAASNGRRARVQGYWSDNWVEEKLEVVVEARQVDRRLRLVGRPVAEMTVEVAANGDSIAKFELTAGKHETIAVDLPSGPRMVVSFAFSRSMVDAAGRPVSFMLEQTDLFREEDLGTRV